MRAVAVVTVCVLVHGTGLAQVAIQQVNPEWKTAAPPAVLPGTTVPPTPLPPTVPVPVPKQTPPAKLEPLPPDAAPAGQPMQPATAGPAERGYGVNSSTPLVLPSNEAIYGPSHWHWTGWLYGPRVAPPWFYPGLPNGVSITYPWGEPGYKGRAAWVGPHGLGIWGPPVPVYTPVPAMCDQSWLYHQKRNVSGPGLHYGWISAFPASPRPRHYAVNSWSTGNDTLPPVQTAFIGTIPKRNGAPLAPVRPMSPPGGTASQTGGYPSGGGCLTLAVKVPRDGAELYVDGVKTMQTGVERVFSSPRLEEGMRFRYEVTARWVENGSVQEMKKYVVGSSGETVQLDFTVPDQVVRPAGK